MDTEPQILLERVRLCAPCDAADALEEASESEALFVLQSLNPMVAQQVLHEMETEHRNELLAAAPAEKAHQWILNREYPEDSVGWLMEESSAVFRPSMTVGETIEALRKLTKKAFITYGYVTDDSNRLLGILVMRDLMLSERSVLLKDVMVSDLFTLKPEMPLLDAMNLAINHHFPIYPVCDEAGHLMGLVRGQAMFEAHAIDLSAQAGAMVGVEKVERLSSPILRSLRFRHPWLQINLLTCFVAAGVVAAFEETLNSIVVLAAFLPVVAGQSGNTGSQALAVTLRGIVLGDLKPGEGRSLVLKESALGFANGLLVGASAALGMYSYASLSDNPRAFELAGVVWLSMVVSCLIGGLCGALIPLALRRFGTDPATASSIFLTTITDAVSMGVFLGLASYLS